MRLGFLLSYIGVKNHQRRHSRKTASAIQESVASRARLPGFSQIPHGTRLDNLQKSRCLLLMNIHLYSHDLVTRDALLIMRDPWRDWDISNILTVQIRTGSDPDLMW